MMPVQQILWIYIFCIFYVQWTLTMMVTTLPITCWYLNHIQEYESSNLLESAKFRRNVSRAHHTQLLTKEGSYSYLSSAFRFNTSESAQTSLLLFRMLFLRLCAAICLAFVPLARLDGVRKTYWINVPIHLKCCLSVINYVQKTQMLYCRPSCHSSKKAILFVLIS